MMFIMLKTKIVVCSIEVLTSLQDYAKVNELAITHVKNQKRPNFWKNFLKSSIHILLSSLHLVMLMPEKIYN